MMPLRFALVGAGAIARAYESAFAVLPGAGIAAVCDVDDAAAAAAAQRLGCPGHPSVASLLKAGGIDAAVVCTPPATHEAIASELLQAGVHVLCEKPLAVDAPQARRMLATASASGTILTMASKFRFASAVRLARELVEHGAIGDLVYVENAFTSYVDMSRRWNSDPAVSGGGVLIDNGTHSVDILRFFLGNLRDVRIVEGRRMQGLPVEDTVRLLVRNDEDVIGSSDLSWSIDKELETYIRLYGSDGTVLVGWKESKFRRRGDPQWHGFDGGYDKIQAFADQLQNFCDAIQGRAALVVSPLDALASVEIVQAAYASLQYARWERLGSRLDDISVVPLRHAQAS
jgi:predicted dehydrogenase